MQYRMPWSTIWNQLKLDLIGKDSYRGITLTYAWLANQFGHFALGFIPAYLLFNCLQEKQSVENPALIAAIITSLSWIVFELFNFLKPLLAKKNQYHFKPAWLNIAFDTGTDMLFFCLGAFTWYVQDTSISGWLNYLPLMIMIVLLWPMYYWFTTKIFLQAAGYPYQRRLSQWQLPILPQQIPIINSFSQLNSSGKHLIISGAAGSGKTSLAVAMATEQSIQHHRCLYFTASKILGNFYEPAISKKTKESLQLWTWREADYLVIDDINAGEPVNDIFITPALFMKHLNAVKDNIDTIQKKNIIWVVEGGADDSFIMDWEAMLLQIGVHPKKIYKVVL